MPTPLEDRIAAAHVLTDPDSGAGGGVEWLADWVGFALRPGDATGARGARAMLRIAPRLAALRGTQAGLEPALDAAHRRLGEPRRARRGGGFPSAAHLRHPARRGLRAPRRSAAARTHRQRQLLRRRHPGAGDETRREFLALFGPGIDLSAGERQVVAEFFERLAHRVTVLAHEALDVATLALVRAIVARETPAHVQARVVVTTEPLLVGIRSLVAVDTYLRRGAAGAARCACRRAASAYAICCSAARCWTPRWATAASESPQARISAPATPAWGESFNLDGSGSAAAAVAPSSATSGRDSPSAATDISREEHRNGHIRHQYADRNRRAADRGDDRPHDPARRRAPPLPTRSHGRCRQPFQARRRDRHRRRSRGAHRRARRAGARRTSARASAFPGAARSTSAAPCAATPGPISGRRSEGSAWRPSPSTRRSSRANRRSRWTPACPSDATVSGSK
ncbi:MAG: hypothetical protein MZV63_40260 [Marinilabiliales bacterium]|nr:hypothetical protein [Marinilabiliales bacterium]